MELGAVKDCGVCARYEVGVAATVACNLHSLQFAKCAAQFGHSYD